MNNLVNDPLLRYASLAGAGLPADERHFARARTRRRVTGVTFTLSLANCTEDVDANRLPEFDVEGDSMDAGAADAGRAKRKLVLLAY